MDCPLLAVRGSIGLEILSGQQNFKEQTMVFKDTSPHCRCMAFSHDGAFFAYCNSERFKVLDTKSWKCILSIPKQKTTDISFSPCSNYVSIWEAFYTTPANPNGSPNLQIYRLSDQVLVKEYIQKNKEVWEPQWTCDEFLNSRIVTNEVHFFQEGQMGAIEKKLILPNIGSYSIAPCPAPYKIAAFVRGAKGAPSFVRLFEYPRLDVAAALANRSFFRADRVRLFWNNQGTALLVLTMSDVDKTGGSYYGEQSLQFMSTKGEGNLVPFVRKGPVYSVDWHSNSSTFAVVQGYMPARAVIFNLKCEPVFDFGTGPRNLCQFNAHGNILCIAGFANLTGIIEMWNVKEKKLVSKCQITDTTEFEWSPNGYHFAVATTAPRLRVGNCYRVCHYTGTVIHQYNIQGTHELWQVCWQPAKQGAYPEPSVASSLVQDTSKPKVEAYRPPSGRGTKPSMKLHTEEPPQNVHQGELSGAALKNKKKREARAKSKQEGGASVAQNQISSSPSGTDGGEREKKMKNLRKKLRQIEDLKEKKRQGKQLEANQLEKLKAEQELWKELKQLELNEDAS